MKNKLNRKQLHDLKCFWDISTEKFLDGHVIRNLRDKINCELFEWLVFEFEDNIFDGITHTFAGDIP